MEEPNSATKPPCDPGWNDPPMFAYESRPVQTNTEKRGNLLNKRVPFPMSGPPSAKSDSIDPTLPLQVCDISSLPPPPSAIKQNAESSNTSDSRESVNDCFNEEEALSDVMRNFNDVIDSKEELKTKAEDIRKRLEVIKKMWEENKFPVIIQQKVLELSKAVKLGDSEKADHLQRGLMVDHASLCSPWMAGIRHILHSLPSALETSARTEPL